MKMLKILNPREKILLYATVIVVAFSILLFFVAPVLEKIDSLNKEINFSKLKLYNYLRLLNQKDYIQREYNKFSSDTASLAQEKDTLMSALSELDTFAQDASIRIVDIRPQNARNPGLYREVLIDLRTEGNMQGHLKFIYNIENSLSLLKIKRFQLSLRPNSQALEGNFSISQLSLPK